MGSKSGGRTCLIRSERSERGARCNSVGLCLSCRVRANFMGPGAKCIGLSSSRDRVAAPFLSHISNVNASVRVAHSRCYPT